jgi:hypothetical protein
MLSSFPATVVIRALTEFQAKLQLQIQAQREMEKRQKEKEKEMGLGKKSEGSLTGKNSLNIFTDFTAIKP